MTRDKIHESEDCINALFYDSIFNVIINSNDPVNRARAFDVLCNMVQSDTQRKKLAEGDTFQEFLKELCRSLKVKNMKTSDF